MRFRVLACVLSLVLAFGCGARRAAEGPESVERMNQDKTAALQLIENGQYQAAAGILAPWASKKVADPQVYSMLAKAEWKVKEYEKAVAHYEDALRLDYTDPYTHLELAQLLVEMGRTGRALTEFELAVQRGERDPLVRYNYGLALYRMNRREDAQAQWLAAYSLDSSNATYAEAVGMGLAAGRSDASALRYFERAAALGADQASFHNNFGLLLQRLGDYERAEAEFTTAVDREPGSSVYRRNLALLYMVSARFALAVPLWEALFAEDADDRTNRIYLARSYLESGSFDASIRVLEDWLQGAAEAKEPPARAPAGRGSAPPVRGGVSAGQESAPPLSDAYDVLARSYRGKQDLGKAGLYMRKALELAPENVVYLINYGVILAEDGKIAEARAQWEKALEIDPGNAAARQNLSAFNQ